MNLKEKYGKGTWDGATTKALIKYKFQDADGGQIEELQQQVDLLKDIVANLIDSMNLRDEKKLEIIGGLFEWELVE